MGGMFVAIKFQREGQGCGPINIHAVGAKPWIDE
jgi:hypothetical protein